MVEQATINWDEFAEKFKPLPNPIDSNASWDGCLLETFGDELDHVRSQRPENIWTLINDSDAEWPSLTSGYHLVNRLGYIITEVPHNGAIIDVLDDDLELRDPDPDDDRCQHCGVALSQRFGLECCDGCSERLAGESESKTGEING
jgi:hypothetical protein